jgi:hypothetical protein
MRALVVYESMFGNTRTVAQAIAEGLAVHADVTLIEVGAAPMAIDAGIALLVVGGPTHAHGMTTPDTRADAGRRAGDQLVSHGVGVREWLPAIARPSADLAVAAFDTRIHGPSILWGSAAKGMGKVIRDAGHDLIVPPESFLVGGPTGPLVDRLLDGETDRARAWGAELGVLASRRAAGSQAVGV